MSNVLNNQICIDCKHEEKRHNISLVDPSRIQCSGYITRYGDDLTEGFVTGGTMLYGCQCKRFRMNNLKYLEDVSQLPGRDNK